MAPVYPIDCKQIPPSDFSDVNEITIYYIYLTSKYPPAGHPLGWDQITGDHNQDGIENPRERRGCEGGTRGSAR